MNFINILGKEAVTLGPSFNLVFVENVKFRDKIVLFLFNLPLEFSSFLDVFISLFFVGIYFEH